MRSVCRKALYLTLLQVSRVMADVPAPPPAPRMATHLAPRGARGCSAGFFTPWLHHRGAGAGRQQALAAAAGDGQGLRLTVTEANTVVPGSS